MGSPIRQHTTVFLFMKNPDLVAWDLVQQWLASPEVHLDVAETESRREQVLKEPRN